MTILITVPHAGCFDYPLERHCDRLAKTAALNLKSFLPDSEIIIGQVFRKDLDLNRDESLDSSFRIKVREKFEEIHPSIVLDIHSFPDETNNFGKADLVILDEKPGTSYGRSLARYLFQETSYRIDYFLGDKNSIMIESRARGIPAILIEYGEFLSSQDLSNLNIVIVDWLEINGYLE